MDNHSVLVSLIETIGEALPVVALICIPPFAILSLPSIVLSTPPESPWPKRVAISYSVVVSAFFCLGWLGARSPGSGIEVGALGNVIASFAIALLICQSPIGKLRSNSGEKQVSRRHRALPRASVIAAVSIIVGGSIFFWIGRNNSSMYSGARGRDSSQFNEGENAFGHLSAPAPRLEPANSAAEYEDVCAWTPMMRVTFRAIYSTRFECWPIEDRVIWSSKLPPEPTEMQMTAHFTLLSTYTLATPNDKAGVGLKMLVPAVRSLSEGEAVALVREIIKRGPATVPKENSPLLPRPMKAEEMLRFYN